MPINGEVMTPALRVQVELALAKARGDVSSLRTLETQARRIRLTGAEIDAAKRGGSFDAIANIAVKFALAVYAGEASAIALWERRLAVISSPSTVTELTALLEKLQISVGK